MQKGRKRFDFSNAEQDADDDQDDGAPDVQAMDDKVPAFF